MVLFQLPSSSDRHLISGPIFLRRNVGRLLREVGLHEISVTDATVTSADEPTFICSYNWKRTMPQNPTIIVPGAPRRWNHPDLNADSPTLERDTGVRYADENSHRAAAKSFEPVFQALSVMNPTLRFNGIHILTDLSCLQALRVWLTNAGTTEPFALGLHFVRKKTLIITARKQSSTSTDPSGYGHNFEHSSTDDVHDLGWMIGTHHRVIGYKLGFLNIAVRHEVDAYYEDPDEPNTAATPYTPVRSADHVNVNSTHRNPTTVRQAGVLIDATAIAEIKSTATPRAIEAYKWQLWFSRTEWLLQGVHSGGQHHTYNVRHAQRRFAQWESDPFSQHGLRKLAALLNGLWMLMEEEEKTSAVVVIEGAMMRVFGTEAPERAVPKELVNKFWD